MVLIVFQAGKERFGLDAADVVEMAPPAAPRTLPHAPSYVAGLLNYRGETVPVIDVSALLTGVPAPLLMSTRLILTRYRGRLLGLLVERAVETTACDTADIQPMPVAVEDAAYLGPVLLDGTGSIQKITVSELLSAPVRELLFPAEQGE